MPITRYLNDGSDAAPRLDVYLNLGTLMDLPDWSTAPKSEGTELLEAIREAGFVGVQGGKPEECAKVNIPNTASTRLNTTDEEASFREEIKQFKDQGHNGVTIHAGWGIEDDDVVDALADIVTQASTDFDFPIFVETHRATITQDGWRTIKLLERKPDLRLNADYSHWYTGQEMWYGTCEMKWDFLDPAFERAGYMHGRIGNPGSMQVDIGSTVEEAMSRDYVQHFAEMWTRTMVGFLKYAGPGDFLVMAPEIIWADIFYARTFIDSDGNLREESDRWAQSLLYKDIALNCFEQAKKRVE